MSKEILDRIYRIIQEDKSFEYIPEQCGWNDGGCWMLAQALHEILPHSTMIGVIPVGRGATMIGHVATKYGDWIIDGSGVRTERGFKRNWELDEGTEIKVVPFTVKLAAPDMPRWKAQSQQLREYLESRLQQPERRRVGKSVTRARTKIVAKAGDSSALLSIRTRK
jgi:hypothetical protein